IAPTVAPPTIFCVHAVAIPVPAMFIAAAIAANGSAIRLNLLCRSESKGTEWNSVALVELDERLHGVEPDVLDSSRDPTQEQYEHRRYDQKGDPADDEA